MAPLPAPLPFLKSIPDECRDLPFEKLPIGVLVAAIFEFGEAWAEMSAAAGVLLDYIQAAHDRFGEGRPDLARKTIRRAIHALGEL